MNGNNNVYLNSLYFDDGKGLQCTIVTSIIPLKQKSVFNYQIRIFIRNAKYMYAYIYFAKKYCVCYMYVLCMLSLEII